MLHNVAVNSGRDAKHCLVSVDAATARVLVVIAVAATLHPGTVPAGADVSSEFIARPPVFVVSAVRSRIIRIAVVAAFHSGTVAAGPDVSSVCIALPQVCVARRKG